MGTTLETLEKELRQALSGLDLVQTQWRGPRRPGRDEPWTIQQIVEHLQLTYKGTIGAFEKRLEKGTPTRTKVTMNQRAAQFQITRLGIFPKGRQAPLVVQPSSEFVALSGAEIGDRVRGELLSLERCATECEKVLGRGRSVTHFVLGPMSMQQWRLFHLTHGRHHVKQVLAIRQREEKRRAP